MKTKKILVGVLATFIIGTTTTYAAVKQYPGPHGDGTGTTPHNWQLTPAGTQVKLGDFPMSGAMSPDQRYVVVSNDGQGKQSLQVYDRKQKKVVQTIPYKSPEALYLGLTFSPDGKMLYASAGGNNKIRVFDFSNGHLSEGKSIKLSDDKNTNFYPAGLSTSPDGKYLFVADNMNHSVSKIDIKSHSIVKTTPVGKNPYTAYYGQNGKLYVSNWGESSITVLNPKTLKTEKTIDVGLHPNAITENPKTGAIYVANSDSDTISMINPKSNKVINTFSLHSKSKKNGSQPDSLTFSDDGQTLYVANAGDNDVSVIDLSSGKPTIQGEIPTGWYPTDVMYSKKDKQLMVLNAKGLGAGPNTDGQYIGNMINGSMSIVNKPNASQLKQYTHQVDKNNTVQRAAHYDSGNFPIPRKVGEASPIKHVIYVIKENRTYDQVFGDMKKGNGDSNLTTFGKKVTPNLHKLANHFVTLDNFYADAEISAQGHNWTTAAKSNDYVEKNWMADYSGRNRGYDFEGTNSATYPKAGFLWNDAKRSNVSFRDYGEFMSYNDAKGYWTPDDPSIGANADPNYPGWNLSISDLTRFKEWNKEFKGYVDHKNLPQFEIVRLPNDHTSGTKTGALTPEAMVAQNDLAVGKLVDAVSHSPYWKNTAIFITEDDAQNGWDHVDAHRTESLVVSPYTQTGKVDSTFYDTTSMVKTMELILGMKPMSQYDASAIPMINSFTTNPNVNPYTAEKPQYPLDAVNGKDAPGAMESNQMDFSKADHINEEKLNHILWKQAHKGKHKGYPNNNK